MKNLEVVKAYEKIRNCKIRYGRYFKTLFHMHTPESYDYKLFNKWKNLSYSRWQNLKIEDYIFEIKERKIFPIEIFNTDLGDEILYANYMENGFLNEKEQISFLTVAQSLYNEGITTVVVTDHNTICGLKKMEKAIQLVSKLGQNKSKDYIEVINGVEISCADRLHVVIVFPEEKCNFVENWLSENLMNLKDGSFQPSLQVLENFVDQDCIAYIAHINSSEVFKEEKHFSKAYKKRLFSPDNCKYIGVSNSEKADDVKSYVSNIDQNSNPSIILDNDSHTIENHSKNIMWIKYSQRIYEQIKEALSEYDVSIELVKNETRKKFFIRGIYIHSNEEEYLFKKNEDFVLKFSDSLNCIIGGRGTGKSTILDLIQLVLSQKADSKEKFEFLSKHSKVYILYELNEKEYIIEMNLPIQKNKEDIYNIYDIKTKSTTKYWYYSSRLSEKIREKYISIFEVTENLQVKKVTSQQKNYLLDQMFDDRYSVNELVNNASYEKMSDYLKGIICKDFKNYNFVNNISSLEDINFIVESEDKKIEKRRNQINSIVYSFNNSQLDKLKILYCQQKEFYIPENFENWFFPIGKDLNKPFKNFRILINEVIDYLSVIFEQKGFLEFVNLMNDRNFSNIKSIRDFAKQSKLNDQILNTDLKEIDEFSENLFIESIYELWNKADINLIQKYLKDIYLNCEKFSLEFNINSKVTDKNKRNVFRDVGSLSLGQKVVAMLDFILGYSEFTNDNRPLLIDQPEDNLDSRYIYNNLVQILRNVKSKRQIIIATHNATLVTNTMSDLVVLMESDGEHGWIESYGYPSEDKIKKHIVNYLEGGKESFEHKAKMYERIIEIK